MKPKTVEPSPNSHRDFSTIEILESRIAPATFTVINTNDSGTGSLRAELALADAHPGLNTIVFHLPAPPLHGANVITLTSGALTSHGDVTIKGPGAGKLIINGGGKYQIFDINNGVGGTNSPATISGLSMIDGAVEKGSAIYSAESLTLKNVIVSGNTATGGLSGFAVNVYGGPGSSTKVTISNSLITGNTGNGGGGIGIYYVKEFNVSHAVITDNTATEGGGGGIFASLNATGTGGAISGCLIEGNTALQGAGVHISDLNPTKTVKITVSGTTITGNTSTDHGKAAGGGVWANYGNIVITGSTIENNSSVYLGGGIDAYHFASLTISKCTISGNRTTATNAIYQGGGGLLADGSGASLPVKITGSHITNNRSDYSGGGIQAINGVALTISSSTISGNAAQMWGGGVSTYGEGAGKVSLSVAGSTLSGNTAQYGGGIATFPTSTPGITGPVSIISSKIAGNEALGGGGGLSIAGASSLTVTNCTVTGNTGVRAGGIGMYFVESFHISGGSVTGNSAATYGGGIECYTSTGSILGTNISGNAAETKGGGVCDNSFGTVTLQIAKVTGNTAPTGPDVYGTFTDV
jgi:hypothetical protein